MLHNLSVEVLEDGGEVDGGAGPRDPRRRLLCHARPWSSSASPSSLRLALVMLDVAFFATLGLGSDSRRRTARH